jgi:hypothetical protein
MKNIYIETLKILEKNMLREYLNLGNWSRERLDKAIQ